MNRHRLLIFALSLSGPCALAQQFTEAIEDNSYLIEEAYNQETRVVQHISTVFFERTSNDVVYSFTQEWPAGGQEHQLSFTIPYQSFNAGSRGIGDLSFNYRFQLWDDHDWGWVAPRLSVILPTGSTSNGLGNGVVGLQACLPVSKRWSNEFVSHFNVGFTVLPNVEGTTSSGGVVKKTLPSYFVGTSGIWLATKNFNVMLEALHVRSSSIDGSGYVKYSDETIVSPGFRFSIDMNELQIKANNLLKKLAEDLNVDNDHRYALRLVVAATLAGLILSTEVKTPTVVIEPMLSLNVANITRYALDVIRDSMRGKDDKTTYEQHISEFIRDNMKDIVVVNGPYNPNVPTQLFNSPRVSLKGRYEKSNERIFIPTSLLKPFALKVHIPYSEFAKQLMATGVLIQKNRQTLLTAGIEGMVHNKLPCWEIDATHPAISDVRQTATDLENKAKGIVDPSKAIASSFTKE